MLLLLLFSTLLTPWASCASFDNWGVSGGSGPKGGIGDAAHPVLKAQAYITDGFVPLKPNTTRQLAQGSPPTLTKGQVPCSSSRRRVVVDSSTKGAQQEMLGFGHAWTDSTVEVFNRLDPKLLDTLMEELFGQTGNNMGFMRHTIGSSDLSGTQYSFDDNGPSFNEGQPDPTLANFTLRDPGIQMVKMLAKMGQHKGDVFLYGAPWSYPGWMKNNALHTAQNLGGNHFLVNNSLNSAYHDQAINYLTKYVDAYKSYGVSVNGLSLQNEPLNYQGGYPCMYLGAADQAAILQKGLGAAMQKRGVKILAYDHNTDQPAYPARVIQGAPGYVDAAAWHCYQGPVADYTVLEDFHYNFPNTPQLMTECSNTGLAVGTNNFWVANNFLSAVRYGASGASFWVLGTDPNYGPHSPYGGCTTCSGSITVHSSTVYEKTIDYYMIGHFSRYIRKGGVNYKILQGLQGLGNDWNSQFFGIAVKNPDGGWAIVLLNSFPQDQYVDLEFTDSGFVWQGTVPQSSVVTWLLPADVRLGAAPPSQGVVTSLLSASQSMSTVVQPSQSIVTSLLSSSQSMSTVVQPSQSVSTSLLSSSQSLSAVPQYTQGIVTSLLPSSQSSSAVPQHSQSVSTSLLHSDQSTGSVSQHPRSITSSVLSSAQEVSAVPQHSLGPPVYTFTHGPHYGPPHEPPHGQHHGPPDAGPPFAWEGGHPSFDVPTFYARQPATKEGGHSSFDIPTFNRRPTHMARTPAALSEARVTCPASTTSSASGTLLPVPHTTHTIA